MSFWFWVLSEWGEDGGEIEKEGCLPSARMIRFAKDGCKSRMVGLMDRLMKPHRRHVYQLLANEMGIDNWKVSVGYGVLVVGLGKDLN